MAVLDGDWEEMPGMMASCPAGAVNVLEWAGCVLADVWAALDAGAAGILRAHPEAAECEDWTTSVSGAVDAVAAACDALQNAIEVLEDGKDGIPGSPPRSWGQFAAIRRAQRRRD